MSDQSITGAPKENPIPQNGMGTAALVLGIVGLTVGWCAYGIPSILAVIFGAIGLKKANAGIANNRTMALWGLWLGIIGVAIGLILSLIFGAAIIASLVDSGSM